MACFGGGMRTRSAGVILPRTSVIIGNTTMILPAQLEVSSPNAPRMVRLLVLFSTSPRSSLVNQTHELLLRLAVLLEHFFGNGFDAEFRIPLEIFSSAGISTCRNQKRTAP